MRRSSLKGLIALSPLIVFICIYLVTSIVANDFYKVPITVAFMFSCIYAIFTIKGTSIKERIQTFSQGASQPNIMLMIWIFILAGAFASSAKGMGCIDATVDLTLAVMPSEMILSGLFIASCLISLSIGTSVGTIVALTPIAVGLASSTGNPTALMTAAIVGGSFFGDNLSFISDTTVAATQSQGCKMNEKFYANIRIVIPAAIMTLILYIFAGSSTTSYTHTGSIDLIKVLPYLVVLVTAVYGLNVLAVLVLGIVLTGAIGFFNGSYDYFSWLAQMGEGILSMSELIIVTMLAGGLLAIIRFNGGLEFIIRNITRCINGRRGAEATIAGIVSLINICTANNTIAIITVGGIAREISEKYGITPRRSASLLDTFSCITQGILPYGAQLLMAAGLAALNPVDIIPYLYYNMILCLVAVAFIVWQGRGTSRTVVTQ